MRRANLSWLLLLLMTAMIVLFPVERAKAAALTIPTPVNGWKFSTGKTVRYFFSSGFSSEQKAIIRNGFSMWNGYGNVSVIETTSASLADINVISTTILFSGALGEAFHPIYGGSENSPSGYTKRTIAFYTNNLPSAPNAIWRTTACHEMGHQLGLAHNTTTNASVMRSSIDLCAASPQYVDYLTIQTIYP